MIRLTVEARTLKMNNVADFGVFNVTSMSNSGNYIVTHESL